MRIMVALRTGEQHSAAVDRALAIAGKQHAVLLLFTAVYEPHIAGSRFGQDEQMQAQQRRAVELELTSLRATAEILRESISRVEISRVEVDARWVHPTADAIVERANEFSASLLILAASEHSALGRFFLASTDWEVIRTSRLPVLLAKNSPYRPYKTVLVAVDPTHSHDEPATLDNNLIDSARLLAEPFDGSVFLAHAAPTTVTLIADDCVPSAQEVLSAQRAHAQSVRSLAQQAGIEADHIRIENGSPTSIVPKITRELDADLVVLGSVSRSLLSRLLIGKTTEHILGELESDVLVVAAEVVDGN